MKKKPSSGTDQSEVESSDRSALTRREYVQSLRQHYLNGTLDEVLTADMDIPDTLVAAIYPELFQ